MIALAYRPADLRRYAWIAAVAILALASGCSPDIGDNCTVSTDCSVTGDRLCDSTQPGGYCTVFNCEPNACPKNSVCVMFEDPTCSSPTQSVRFQRTFCMATCESDAECRAGYRCFDVSADPSRRVIDRDPSTRLICAAIPLSSTPPPPPPDAEPAVCRAVDSGVTSTPTTDSSPQADTAPPEGGAGEADAASTSDVSVDALSE